MRKPYIAAIVAIVAFLLLFGATRFYISLNVDLTNVVVAAEPIPPRTQIEPGALKVIQVPKGYAPEGSAPNTGIFADETYFTGELGLHAGEIITKEKVFTEDNIIHAHTLTLGPGETILGISTDLVRSAGASVYPGSRVRALAYVAPRQDSWQGDSEPSKVEVVFDNLRVVGTVNTEANDTSTQEQRGKVPAVVKIAVTPEQERVLIKYQEEHRVWFTLLPEGYEPDPNIEDYYHRIAQGEEGDAPVETQEPVSVRTF